MIREDFVRIVFAGRVSLFVARLELKARRRDANDGDISRSKGWALR